MFSRLFATKSIERLREEMAADEGRLRRVLGPIGLTSLGIGAIIGAGIFVIAGEVAANRAGPGVVISFAVAGIGCALAALCYAEFAALAPVAGSAYTYAYATLGELFAWIIGWDLLLEYAMSCSTIAASWSKYLNAFTDIVFGWQVPDYLCHDPYSMPGAWFNLPAVLVLAVVTVVLVVGIRESALTNTILVVIKIGVVLFVIALGALYIDPANWTTIPVERRKILENPAEGWGMLGQIGIYQWLGPIDDATRTRFTPYGFSGLMVGSAIVFFAYIGFDSISTHSEEAVHPTRDVPFAILASLVICTLLYAGIAAVITGMVPYPNIDPHAAMATAFSQRADAEGGNPMLKAASALIALGGLAGMTSVILITYLSQARIFLAMARDGLLPRSVFATVHPTFKTPHLSTMLVGAVTAVVAAFTPISLLEEMVSIGTLFAFVVVCAAVLILRIRRPDAHRPFRCPWVFVIAPFGVLVNLAMMLFLSEHSWWRLGGWLLIGVLLYFSFGYWNSTLRRRSAAAAA